MIKLILALAIVAATTGCATRPMTKQEALLTAAALMIYKVHREDSVKDRIQLTADNSML